MLSIAKTNALAELLRDVGNIFFASVFLGPLLEKPNFLAMFLGLIFAFVAWYLGIRLVKG